MAIPITHNFFCRMCGKKELASRVPAGWYTVQRKAGDARYARLGIFCSALCLAKSATEYMTPAEDDMGDDWVNRVSLAQPYRGVEEAPVAR